MPPGEGKCLWAAGDHYFFKNTGADTGGTYSLFEGLVPPGGGPPPHFHQREYEAFYVLEGELTFHANGASTVAGPGTFVHIPKDLLHTFKNESHRNARMLAIVAPAGMEDFLEEIGYPVVRPHVHTQADERGRRREDPAQSRPSTASASSCRIARRAAGPARLAGTMERRRTMPRRDDEAQVTFYVLLWKRKGISLASFDDYWRDVHGPVCARLPGQFQYWQFHVAHNEGGHLPGGRPASATPRPTTDQFDGIAELTFRSLADRQTWFDAAGILMDDEHNIFSKAIGYVTEPGNSQHLCRRHCRRRSERRRRAASSSTCWSARRPASATPSSAAT